MDFAGKVAIVTGGASGMGAATVALFAAAGATVLIVDRNQGLAQQVAITHNLPAPLIGDIADATFCERAVQHAVDHYGRRDVLVNAAGTIVRADALHTSDEEWLQVLNVNTSGLFYLSRAAVRVMKAQGSGAIVNFGSIWGNVGGKGHVAYCASKGAVHQITRAMALDHARDGIRINAVAPGNILFDGSVWSRKLAEDEQAVQSMLQKDVALGCLGAPADVASLVAYLASPLSRFASGGIWTLDGGQVHS